MRLKAFITAVMLCLALALPGRASAQEEEGKVDVPEIIFGHIGDSYEWHITAFPSGF